MEEKAFFATTVMGLEDVCAGEVQRILGLSERPELGRGRIFFRGPLEAIYELNIRARTLHKLFLLLHRGRFESLRDIYLAARRLDYTDIIRPDQSFAIRAERVGQHDFTSMDVAAQVGQAVIDSYTASRGVRLKVNLDEPDVEIYAFVRDDEFLLGVNTTGPSLHKRGYRVFKHPAALRTSVAAAMLYLAGWDGRGLLLDPMCGGGTIPIEGALMARRVPPGSFRRGEFAFLSLPFADEEEFSRRLEEALRAASKDRFNIIGMDKFRAYLDGAARNARSAGVEDTITFVQGDATRLADYLAEAPTHVVVNPPYGVRFKLRGLMRLYKGFLSSLSDLAPGCRLVLITAAKGTFRRAAEGAGVEVLEERRILHGDMWASIFICRA
ncbi:hypothetical protein DRO33_01970 [Candidatus Bathyarchaeota archaeon]|nr:MAG: hypothetical protein DRO33_01970 [Candidatus Bathyarchaeota archaeon]